MKLTRIAVVGLLALIAATLLAIALGTVYVPPLTILKTIVSALLPGITPSIQSAADQTNQILIILIRLPRVFAAILAGAGLALAGTAMQGIFRNPLAEPGILGVSAGASLGALVSIAFGAISFLTLPLFAFVGASVAVLFILILASVAGNRGTTTVLILAGMAVSAFFSALTSLILVLASEYQVSSYIFWTLGGLSNRRWEHVFLMAVPVLVVGLILLYKGRDLDILLLGDEEARSLGVAPRTTRLLTVSLASFLTAIIVSVTGPIGFVGLVVPHIMRFLVGPSHRRLLLASAFGGAILLLLCDLVTRLVAMPRGIELSVGVVTALVGAPYFMFLLIRSLKVR
ncbi:MAG: iron ABC transporter permease [Eubacteriales bacterium]|nr:iron ABC transporter permease [Eubacteriales bacterium]